ncbi:MAG: Holliday junction resolvase RuvX [bacterium]|nr:Holliday junction resolvase RuvX [bacterium]
MRYLGIDYGTKRVGIALSDEAGEFAMPLIVLQNNNSLFPALKKIILEKKIGAIVLGESKNFKGEDNAIMSDITDFKNKFESETSLPVFLEPEFMTSAEANQEPERAGENRRSGLRLRRPKVKNIMHDASAAALILKSYLEKQK